MLTTLPKMSEVAVEGVSRRGEVFKMKCDTRGKERSIYEVDP